MKIPYQLLQVAGDCIIAARGSSLHTFNLRDGAHLFTWRHPGAKSDEKGGKPVSQVQNGASAPTQNRPTSDTAQGVEEGPPSKRLRLDGTTEPDQGSPSEADPGDVREKTGEPHGGKASKSRNGETGKAQERPVINVLVCTSDGRHVVTVTGIEKTIRVFEHDGVGSLELLSER